MLRNHIKPVVKKPHRFHCIFPVSDLSENMQEVREDIISKGFCGSRTTRSGVKIDPKRSKN